MVLNWTNHLRRQAQLVRYPQAWQELGRRLYQRWIRPVGFGVRAMVFDRDGKVLLLRHTYLPGWHFPGGGVEPDESLAEALARELIEESGVAITAPPALHGIFLQKMRWRSNHVACFIVRGFHQAHARLPDWEIAELGFFDPQALPEGASRATRARLDEVLNGAPISRTW